jgi:HAD superfamily hydrolase (TIGR01509 family)
MTLKFLPPFGAIIFDLDGLAIDSETTYREAWKAAGKALGYPLNDALVRRFTGKPYDLIEKILRSRFGAQFPTTDFRQESAQFWHEKVEQSGIPRKPGLDELLEILKIRSIPYALATNSQAVYADKCLKYAGLSEEFPIRITRDQAITPKPAPDLFLIAAERLAVPPKQCIVLEDSETGAQAGLNAGMPVILVPEAGEFPNPIHENMLAVLDSLNQVRTLIENTFANCRAGSAESG